MESNDDQNLILELTYPEYSALSNIRGMNEKAHYLVMTADFKTINNRTKVVLTGKEEDFKDLYHEINEVIGEEFCPQKDVQKLERIYKKLIKPDSPFGIMEYE